MQERLSSVIGYRAAIAVSIETILFAISLILGLTVRSSFETTAGYVICIFLAASVIVMMAAAYVRSPEGHRILGLLALSAAIVYAPFCMATYFVQLAVVAQNPLTLPPDMLTLVAFVPGAPLFAIDMLGYAFLCLSTLAIAFTLRDSRDKVLKVLCIVHGALVVPTLAGPIISGLYRSSGGQTNDVGNWVLLFWCALFTPIPLLFARLFRRELRHQ